MQLWKMICEPWLNTPWSLRRRKSPPTGGETTIEQDARRAGGITIKKIFGESTDGDRNRQRSQSGILT